MPPYLALTAALILARGSPALPCKQVALTNTMQQTVDNQPHLALTAALILACRSSGLPSPVSLNTLWGAPCSTVTSGIDTAASDGGG